MQLVKNKYVLLEATFEGLYRLEGIKTDRCTHTSCGYDSSKNQHQKRVPCYVVRSYNAALKDGKSKGWTTAKALRVWESDEWGGNSVENAHKHLSKNCEPMWCVVSTGRPKPSVFKDGKVNCSRQYYTKYTTQELAHPDTKPEAAAILMTVAQLYVGIQHGAVALYDLLGDKWALNSWWEIPHANKDIVMPTTRDYDLPSPDQIILVNEAIETLKKKL